MADNVTQIVLESLDSEDPNILRAACHMAGVLELGKAERGLLKAVGHKAWQVQAEAARALGRIKAAGALPYLRRLLKASESELRGKMLAAAAGKGKPPSDDESETHPEVAHAAAVAINQLDSKVTQDALLAALGSDQATLLSAAMVGLANLESTAGSERMVELLENADAAIRRTAAACLGKLRAKEAVPKLVELLENEDAAVRKEAVIALNHIKDRRALGAMGDCMGDKDAEVRRVAAIAMGNTRLRQEELVQALIKGLRDRDANVRKACLSALANLKAEEALEAAAGLLKDTDEEVSRQAGVTVVVLGQIREKPDYDNG
jgi:HEAT repeat protein